MRRCPSSSPATAGITGSSSAAGCGRSRARESSSCSFLNRAALDETLRSMGLEPVRHAVMEGSRTEPRPGTPSVERMLAVYRKADDGPPAHWTSSYWRGLHTRISRGPDD